MNSTVSLSEQFRCSFPETRALSDEFLSWRRDMKWIWISGASFSALGFGLLVASAVVFPAWRNDDQNKVWLHMCSSSLAFVLVYASRDFTVCYDKITVSVLTYLAQVKLFWLSVGAWLAYKRLVIVFLGRNDGFMTRASLVSWLTPVPFSLLRFALDAIVYPDIMFGDGAEVWIQINGYNLKPKKLLDLIYYIKDVAMYFPVFMCIMGSGLLYVKVVYELMWKRSDVIVFRNGKPASALQDRRGNVIIAIMFLIKSGLQFSLVMFTRFYTFTHLDYFTAFLMTYHVFICVLVFVFAVKSSRDLWVGLVRRKINWIVCFRSLDIRP